MANYTIWFIVGAILIALEVFAPGMVIIWFGFGALVAGLVALLGGGIVLQIIVFIIISVVSVLIAKKLLKKKEKAGRKVGAERLIGKKGRVLVDIAPGEFGRVKVESEEWLAGADEKIPVDSWIIVEKLDGAHLYVKKIEESE